LGAIVSVLCPSLNRSKRPLQWPDLAEDRLRLDRFSATAPSQLSSPAGAGTVIPRGDKKVPPLLSSPRLRGGAPAIVSVLSIAIEAAMVRVRKRKTET